MIILTEGQQSNQNFQQCVSACCKSGSFIKKDRTREAYCDYNLLLLLKLKKICCRLYLEKFTGIPIAAMHASKNILILFLGITSKFRKHSLQNVWIAQVSAHRNKGKERGVLPTLWMKKIIRAVPGCFVGCGLPWILENISELSLCFQAGRVETEELFELGVNAVKIVELAYLCPGSARGDYRQCFCVTELTASSNGCFKGSPSLAGLCLHLTQLWLHKEGIWIPMPILKAFNWQHGKGDNQSVCVLLCKTQVKNVQLQLNGIYRLMEA